MLGDRKNGYIYYQCMADKATMDTPDEEHGNCDGAFVIPQVIREPRPTPKKHWMAKTIVIELGDIVLTAKHSNKRRKKQSTQALPSDWIPIE